MPRRPRIMPPGIPLHVTHRGHNRSSCFHGDGDRERYLHDLRELSEANGCRVHAFVLMGNHVHLLVTADSAVGVSRMMKGVAQRHSQFMNWKNRTTGSWWEGRFHTCSVQTGFYFFACHRYIELNPVRAGLVRHPREYRWSSYLCNAEGRPSSIVEPHPEYLSLGSDPAARLAAYRTLFEAGLDEGVTKEIRDSTSGGFAVGTADFHADLEARYGIRTRRIHRRHDAPDRLLQRTKGV